MKFKCPVKQSIADNFQPLIDEARANGDTDLLMGIVVTRAHALRQSAAIQAKLPAVPLAAHVEAGASLTPAAPDWLSIFGLLSPILAGLFPAGSSIANVISLVLSLFTTQPAAS